VGRAVSPHVEDRDRHDLATCLAEIDQALTDLLEARDLRYVSEATCSPDALPLVHTVNRMIKLVKEIGEFVVPLSRGELSVPLPSAENEMAVPLVEMHGRLSQLTRQTQEIARGDYTQRIDFMGDFSEAFNSMVVLLEERERKLTEEIALRAKAEEELQRERDLLVAGPVVTFRWGVDDEGTVQYVSPNIAAYGYTPEEFTSGRRTYGSIVDPADLGWIADDGNDKSRAGLESWVQEYRVLDADGEVHWIRDFTHAVRGEGEHGAVTAFEGYIIDITPQKAAETALRQREEQLRMLSLTDELTGLYNRRGLFALGEHTLRIARRRARGLGVIYVDVDGLKAINDRFGHSQGDEALCAAADVIRASTRESDVAGRVGGDEFVILVEDEPAVTADMLVRLRRRIERTNAKSGHPYKLSLSIGTIDWEPGDRASLQELIERADQRMYDDKRAGRQDAGPVGERNKP
jgi:diguanylate cyclase (GGDEF)-like protein/PAS domain S-box-containing protein